MPKSILIVCFAIFIQQRKNVMDPGNLSERNIFQLNFGNFIPLAKCRVWCHLAFWVIYDNTNYLKLLAGVIKLDVHSHCIYLQMVVYGARDMSTCEHTSSVPLKQSSSFHPISNLCFHADVGLSQMLVLTEHASELEAKKSLTLYRMHTCVCY